MSAIGPGDWVEFIGVDDGAAPFPGHIYCVEVVEAGGWCWRCESTVGVDLVGLPADPERLFCGGCELRPIYRPRADLIRQLQQPPPEAVRELEDV